MARTITQRELRNESGEIMRRVEAGETFIVTRSGVPIAQVTPLRPRTFVPKDVVLAAFKGAPPMDYVKFREDIDRLVDQDLTPRG